MGALLASVLPLAIGAAISPTLLALQLLVLSGTRDRLGRAWALAAGAALVLVAFSVLGVTVLDRLRPADPHHHSVTDAVIMFGAAALLVLLAGRGLLRHPTQAEQHQRRTAGRFETAPRVWFLGVGAVGMLVNFSTLVLFLPALHLVTRSTVAVVERGAVYVILFVVVLVPVLVPVTLVSLLGARVDPALDTTHAFVARHSRTIGTVIELVFAAYLVVKGIGELP